MKTVDDYLFSLPYNVLGAILRGGENEKDQNLDKNQDMAKAEQATDIQAEAHKH